MLPGRQKLHGDKVIKEREKIYEPEIFRAAYRVYFCRGSA